MSGLNYILIQTNLGENLSRGVKGPNDDTAVQSFIKGYPLVGLAGYQSSSVIKGISFITYHCAGKQPSLTITQDKEGLGRAGKIVIGILVPFTTILACTQIIMCIRKKNSSNRKNVTKKEIQLETDIEQAPDPLGKQGSQADEDKNRVETERNLFEKDDAKSKVRNGEEQAELDLGLNRKLG